MGKLQMPRLSLFLLGSPRIEQEGAPVELGSRKVLALIAYLAVSGEHHARDAIAALLWPDSDQAHARAALRNTIWMLKKAISGDWLQVSRESIGLNPDAGLWLDVDQFRNCLAKCRRHGHPETDVCPDCLTPLTEAVGLYRDNFLTGFTLRDSPGFDEWQLYWSQQLCGQVIGALERLTSYHSAHQEFEPAIQYTRRWLALDPLHEPAYRQLMLLNTWAGRRTDALRQYQVCVQVLEEELGVPPQEETSRLCQDIEESRVSPPPRRPPPRVLATRPHNLPPQPTPFVGREEELVRIDRLLKDPDCRLVTLMGLGGIGKTRLAIQAAAQKVDDFTHGVYFVPLAPVRSPALLVSTLASALKFTFYGRQSPQVQLLDFLSEKNMLLVMDNFEHLLDGAGVLVEILQAAPEVKFLVTSRERLNLRWEWLLDVPGLDYPENGLIKDLQSYSAVQLFLQCAQRVRADFSLTESEQPSVIRTCQLVEGIPVAIELAAAWVRVHSCAEIAQEVGRNLRFLSTSLRDIPERHRSLWAVFEHSWQLLSAKEREVFFKLSVFRGSFGLEAATEVAGSSPAILSALVDKSLLRETPSGRYQMIEVVRHYAEEKLKEIVGKEGKARALHCAYYAGFLGQREHRLRGKGQQQALVEISEEIGNVRAGWDWAVEQGNIEEMDRSIRSLFFFYTIRGMVQEGGAAFELAAERLKAIAEAAGDLDKEHGLLLGRVLARWAWFCLSLSCRQKAGELVQESLELFRRFGTRKEMAFALNQWGNVAFYRGQYAEAKQHYQESLDINRGAGDRLGCSTSLLGLGTVSLVLGEYAEARQLYQECLVLRREVGDKYGTATALTNLANITRVMGEYTESKQWYQECLIVFQEMASSWGKARTLHNLGLVSTLLGEYAEAKRLYQESVDIKRDLGDRPGMAISYSGLGDVAYALEEYARAKELAQASLEMFREVGDRRGMAFTLNNLGRAARVLGDYGESKNHLREALEIATELQMLPIVMVVLTETATLLAKEGEREAAAELLGVVLDHPASERETKDLAEELLSELKGQLPPQTIAQALERGKASALDEVTEGILAEESPAGG